VRGYDGGKRIKGRKHHLVVDVMGLLLLVCVHSAGIQDRDGAKSVLEALVAGFPGVQLIWADGGYAGKLVDWVATHLQRVLLIVKRPRKSGFKVLQWRWIVERTFGWLNRSRRLSNIDPRRHAAEPRERETSSKLSRKHIEPSRRLEGRRHCKASTKTLDPAPRLSNAETPAGPAECLSGDGRAARLLALRDVHRQDVLSLGNRPKSSITWMWQCWVSDQRQRTKL